MAGTSLCFHSVCVTLVFCVTVSTSGTKGEFGLVWITQLVCSYVVDLLTMRPWLPLSLPEVRNLRHVALCMTPLKNVCENAMFCIKTNIKQDIAFEIPLALLAISGEV